MTKTQAAVVKAAIQWQKAYALSAYDDADARKARRDLNHAVLTLLKTTPKRRGK